MLELTTDISGLNGYEFGFTTEHPDYIHRKEQWKFVRDWVAGSDAIKRQGERYLPRPIGMSERRYKMLLDRAVVVNYVDQTLEGTHGMIFRRKPAMQYPPTLKPYIDNINREGDNLYQFLSDTVYDIMQTGFGGYMIDIPAIGDKATVADAEKEGVRPYITYYPAESVINWRTKVVRGTKILTLVVLKEAYEAGIDEFTHKIDYQYRVLRLVDDVYSQSLYRIVDEQAGKYTREDFPFKSNGKTLNYIPFVFAPAATPDKPMLLDIAQVNRGHYCKSADYENGVHLTTIPTGYVVGEAPQLDSKKTIQPIYLGQDSFLMFPNENAKVGILNYAGEGLTHCEEALNAAELQMVVLGSRIITPEKGISETAESANIHRAGENAKLATFANNMSTVITKALTILAKMCGETDAVDVRLNTDYETTGFDANALNAMANIFSQGKLPLIALYKMMLRGEYLDPNMSYEDYVLLLGLESEGLSPIEVYEAYKMAKNSNKMPKLPKYDPTFGQNQDNPATPNNNKAKSDDKSSTSDDKDKKPSDKDKKPTDKVRKAAVNPVK